MSDMSDEDLLEARISRPRSSAAVAAARKITALSDDESDDELRPTSSVVRSRGARHDEDGDGDDDVDDDNDDVNDRNEGSRRRTGQRNRDHDEDSIGSPRRSPVTRGGDDDGGGDGDDGGIPDTPPPSTPPPAHSPPAVEQRQHRTRPMDSYQRTLSCTAAAAPHNVDVIHFPPSISFPSALTTTLENLPAEATPILFRLRPAFSSIAASDDELTPVDVLLREASRVGFDAVAMSDIIESNANIVTWSDGSRTLAIGQQHFHLVEDAVASQQFVFRRGEKVQTYDADVSRVLRAQPATTGDARAKLVMAKAVERSGGRRTSSKTILRTMEDDAENQERQAKLESHKRERERARIEARRRQVRERFAKPERTLSVNAIESNDEEDSADDHVNRMAERMDASRLLRAKRAAPASGRNADIALKRRKAGARRVLGEDDDSESD